MTNRAKADNTNLCLSYRCLIDILVNRVAPVQPEHDRVFGISDKVFLKEIIKILEATVITDSVDLDMQIQSACSADMMSAVLYYHTPNSLLITGLAQSQVIRTAEIAGITTIVFVLNKKPSENIIELAKQKKIQLLSTPLCMYTASGKLFQSGLPSCLNK